MYDEGYFGSVYYYNGVNLSSVFRVIKLMWTLIWALFCMDDEYNLGSIFCMMIMI